MLDRQKVFTPEHELQKNMSDRKFSLQNVKRQKENMADRQKFFTLERETSETGRPLRILGFSYPGKPILTFNSFLGKAMEFLLPQRKCNKMIVPKK